MEKRLSSREVFKGRIVTVRVDEVETPSGRRTTREVVERPDTVSVLAIDAREQVLLVRQYRYPAEKATLEIPAGTIDRGESGEEAARRELREEAGFDCRILEALTTYYPAIGYSSERMTIYLARGLTQSPLKGDEEDIRLERLPFDEVHRRACAGSSFLDDGKSIIAALAARAQGKA